YDGQNGILLASRWPLNNREVIRLKSSFSNRVALFATIELVGFEPIEIACAHISTSNAVPPNYPEFTTWDEEMIDQIKTISTRLKQRAGNHPMLFFGDMNAGPAIGEEILALAVHVWNRIVEFGFISPAARSLTPFCSMCNDNTLRPNGSKDYLIDHVLVRDPAGGTELKPVCAYPIYDQRRIFKGYNGEWVDLHLSDHRGVVVKFHLTAVRQ
ncbi:MAG TPA: hypothetical protein VJB62_02035, partial [Patescibacteria group bacterium]|nr:hypothetical protein [Patescibacteria group bacterium]